MTTKDKLEYVLEYLTELGDLVDMRDAHDLIVNQIEYPIDLLKEVMEEL